MRTGLLTEQDREKFRQADHALAAGGKEKAYVQKFYLYMNLTKPSEKLKIYYSKVSAGGKAQRPSYLIQELSRLYPELKVQDEEAKKLKEKELTEKGWSCLFDSWDCRRRIWTSPRRNYIPGIRNLRNGTLRWTGFCAHGITGVRKIHYRNV